MRQETVNVSELKAKLSHYLEQVSAHRRRILVRNAKKNKIIAVILPIHELARLDYLAGRAESYDED